MESQPIVRLDEVAKSYRSNSEYESRNFSRSSLPAATAAFLTRAWILLLASATAWSMAASLSPDRMPADAEKACMLWQAAGRVRWGGCRGWTPGRSGGRLEARGM